jgi:hypothetical protein
MFREDNDKRCVAEIGGHAGRCRACIASDEEREAKKRWHRPISSAAKLALRTSASYPASGHILLRYLRNLSWPFVAVSNSQQSFFLLHANLINLIIM